MITRRIAAGLIGAGIILTGTAHATQPSPEHKVTICHSGNGKHFTVNQVDYKGARGHAKTDEFDIIPAFEDFPGQNLTPENIYRLEHQCNEATTTTTQSTPTTSLPSTTIIPTSTVTSLPTTTTTTLPASTTTTTVVPETSTSTTTLPPATTTTTIVAPNSTATTINTPSTVSLPPSSTPTPTLVTTITVSPAPTTTTTITAQLPVTGSEPTGLVHGGLVLLALGLILVIVGR